MKPKTWSYPNDTFRGYVVVYDGRSTAEVHCKEVRVNRLKATEDAKKLLKKLKHEKQSSPHSL